MWVLTRSAQSRESAVVVGLEVRLDVETRQAQKSPREIETGEDTRQLARSAELVLEEQFEHQGR